MKVVIQEQPFDPNQQVADYQDTLKQGSYGGVVTFVGTMRDYNDGHQDATMHLEHYPGMTERHIEEVCQEALGQWRVMDILVVHRTGEIHPNDPIVLVAVWSAHRADAFDACRYVINYLKERAPFWKREVTPDGARWVEHNTKDHGVAASVKRPA